MMMAMMINVRIVFVKLVVILQVQVFKLESQIRKIYLQTKNRRRNKKITEMMEELKEMNKRINKIIRNSNNNK